MSSSAAPISVQRLLNPVSSALQPGPRPYGAVSQYDTASSHADHQPNDYITGSGTPLTESAAFIYGVRVVRG